MIRTRTSRASHPVRGQVLFWLSHFLKRFFFTVVSFISSFFFAGLISSFFFAGLKSPMCGTNSSLTKDVTFRTQSFYITVLFQSDATGLNFLSKFNMTFLSFSEGKIYCIICWLFSYRGDSGPITVSREYRRLISVADYDIKPIQNRHILTRVCASILPRRVVSAI